jgi:predicted dehydrogenase
VGDLGIAVIGTGAWGQNHVRAFARAEGCRIVALCDLDPEALHRAHAITDAASTTDLDAVLDRSDVEGVVIATPSPTHADLTCRALAAGKHVLVEKPLAMAVSDAERVATAASSARRTVLVGHLMLYHPAVVRLREIVRAGELGRVRYIHATRVNLGRLRRDENVLWSFGPHDLSMIDFLLDASPLAVAARGASYVQPGIEDVVFLTLQLPDQVLAQVHLSWLEPRKARSLAIIGSHRMAEFDDLAPEKLRIHDRGYDRPPEFTQYGEYLTIRHNRVQLPDFEMDEPLQVMARHFVACCNGAVPMTDVAGGLRVVRVLDAARKSLEMQGQMVAIEGS